ncbi:hypothetical protein IV203_022170 [Nitzschia inconspicua]|uniref:Uncharacterized protein n=1 Tax=Nitzschia inconspicua TaxID=303405 RepID=A0A9K3KI47_9STRA|nr:hypothetical protein IV203_022170 [Nitzschia inconspicua]
MVTPPPSDDGNHDDSNGDQKLLAIERSTNSQCEGRTEVEAQFGDDDIKNGVTQSIPPSHILEDGRFIYLPPPNPVERSRFFERSIARHGILEADMNKQETQLLEEEKQAEQDDKTAPKIHPLAVASARIQSNGLNELNRAINLATLVQTGEYFSYTNIVDPSLEADAAASATKSTSGNTSNSTPSSSNLELTTQRTEALFCLKRKVTQFEKASKVLKRHEKRLRAGIEAQKFIDRRLFQLRQHWRLVAPEHGTRARLHATRTNEVIAIDVDVYDRNRVVSGGSNGLLGNDPRKAISLAGRLASRVPRFATIELQDDFQTNLEKDVTTTTTTATTTSKTTGGQINDDQSLAMANDAEDGSSQDVEMEDADDGKTNGKEIRPMGSIEDQFAKYTRAEPFAIADPSLGRVMENFDPSKIPMLSLQLDIQKRSSGFFQSARLEPMSTLTADVHGKPSSSDEDLLISLQHSLFCANLFESMRSELDPDNISSGTKSATTSFTPVKPKSLQSMAWLSSESDENFVPPPSFLVGGDVTRGLAELSVIHCHEGEVQVQLDCEYQLCLKLVEANLEEGESKRLQKETTKDMGGTDEGSGSQSSAQIHAICQALLLHAQNVYHQHSLYLGQREKKKREEEASKGDAPRGLARVKKEDIPEKARILQSCVSLGSKLLFEQRIRKALSRVSAWLHTTYGESIQVEWLALSIFDLHSKFTISCRHYVVDGVIARDNITLTRITDAEDYRKARFHSEKEFEVYLRLELKRHLK